MKTNDSLTYDSGFIGKTFSYTYGLGRIKNNINNTWVTGLTLNSSDKSIVLSNSGMYLYDRTFGANQIAYLNHNKFYINDLLTRRIAIDPNLIRLTTDTDEDGSGTINLELTNSSSLLTFNDSTANIKTDTQVIQYVATTDKKKDLYNEPRRTLITKSFLDDREQEYMHYRFENSNVWEITKNFSPTSTLNETINTNEKVIQSISVTSFTDKVQVSGSLMIKITNSDNLGPMVLRLRTNNTRKDTVDGKIVYSLISQPIQTKLPEDDEYDLNYYSFPINCYIEGLIKNSSTNVSIQLISGSGTYDLSKASGNLTWLGVNYDSRT